MQKLRIGVAGLGRAFALMLPTFMADPRVALAAAADPRREARSRFTKDFGASAYDNVEALCADPGVDVVYVATPHQLHAAHVTLAAKAGKHVLVEKPMAISLAECAAMIAAARAGKVQLIAGHSHSFNAPVLRARNLIDSGIYGSPRLITALNYTDFVYRPRRPEEFDTAQGGGVVFSQGAHQIDIVRLLAGSRAVAIRAFTGAWDAKRKMDGAYAALLSFESGTAASLTYCGYGHFDSDEFQNWIGEMGNKRNAVPKTRHTFPSESEEAEFKQSRNFGGGSYREAAAPEAHQHFGTFLVSCEGADLRPMPNGVMIYRNGEGALDPLPPPKIPRVEVIDELYGAVFDGVAPKHSGESAMATLEICLAILQSSRENREIRLETK